MNISDLITQDYKREFTNGQVVLKEKKPNMRIKLTKLTDNSCVIKFKPMCSHSPIINCHNMEVCGYERTATKICDYMIMLYDGGTYIPLLIEMNKIVANLDLNDKFEQLYCTWPLCEYIRMIVNRTFSSPIKVAEPYFLLLYEVEKTGNTIAFHDSNLEKLNWKPTNELPPFPQEAEFVVYEYRKKPNQIHIAKMKVDSKIIVNPFEIIRATDAHRYGNK